uniref:Uncharacterized protein n=1 Tax=Panagrolaimus sp. ES5 TaxID=591445 RepID=A0AC34F1L8_9BILA
MNSSFNFSAHENSSRSDLIRGMHQSRENIEIVLQEVCVQHRNVDSIKNELSQDRRHSECVNTAKVDPSPKVLQRV